MNSVMMKNMMGTYKHILMSKMPDKSECYRIVAKSTAIDEVGMAGSCTGTDVFSYDSWEPEIVITENTEGADISIQELNLSSVMYAWSDKGEAEPSIYTSAGNVAEKFISKPQGMTENRTYDKTLWVKATDRNGKTGNQSQTL